MSKCPQQLPAPWGSMSECCQHPQAPSTPSSCTVAGSSPSTPAAPRCSRLVLKAPEALPPQAHQPFLWVENTALPSPHTRAQLGSLPPPRVSSSCLLTGSHPQHGLVFPFFLCSALLTPCKEPINCRICFVRERYPGYYEDLISLMVFSHVRNKELANY